MLCKGLIWLLKFLTRKCLFCALLSRSVIWQQHCLKWTEEVLLAPLAVKYCKSWVYIWPYCIALCLQILFSAMVNPLSKQSGIWFVGKWDICGIIVLHAFWVMSAALKYTTTFPVIFISALKYHVELEFWFGRLRPLWVLCAVLNSCYSFYWDITKDWDLGFVSQPADWKSGSLAIVSVKVAVDDNILYQKSEHLEFALHEYPQCWTFRRLVYAYLTADK